MTIVQNFARLVKERQFAVRVFARAFVPGEFLERRRVSDARAAPRRVEFDEEGPFLQWECMKWAGFHLP